MSVRVRSLALSVLLAACEGPIPARERGRMLLGDADVSDSPANVFRCDDCHTVDPGDAPRILPGYTLVDSAFRRSFWGGYERTLLDAMSACRIAFMRGLPFDEDDDDARAILEYLVSESTTDPAPALPLSVPLDIEEVARADPGRGAEVYEAACAHCHGDPGGAVPRRFRLDATHIPADAAGWAALYDEAFPDTPVGLLVIEKVRHGRFFGVGGVMPLFSRESLDDDDLGAVLAFLGV